jgi:hypothetical protein
MIQAQTPFDYLRFFLPSQIMKDISQMLPKYPIDPLLAPLWDEHHMIPAIPFGVVQAFEGLSS